MNKEEEGERFWITEMFCAKADRDRYFFGIIKRWKDNNGNSFVFSRIVMPDDGLIVAQSTDQKTLGIMIDEICIMALDNNLHNVESVKVRILHEDFFLN